MASLIVNGKFGSVLYRAMTEPSKSDGRQQFSTRGDGLLDISVFLTPAEAAQWAQVLTEFAVECGEHGVNAAEVAR